MNEKNVHPMVTYIPMFCQAGVFMSMYVLILLEKFFKESTINQLAIYNQAV